jgi:hypothetical protein
MGLRAQIEDANGWDALGHPLAAVKVDGVIAEQHPIKAVQAVDENG